MSVQVVEVESLLFGVEKEEVEFGDFLHIVHLLAFGNQLEGVLYLEVLWTQKTELVFVADEGEFVEDVGEKEKPDLIFGVDFESEFEGEIGELMHLDVVLGEKTADLLLMFDHKHVSDHQLRGL